MVFNSLSFAVFAAVAFTIYWSLAGRRRLQNAFLLIVSYVFYGWWDWHYLFLIFGCTAVNYVAGKIISSSTHKVVRWLVFLTCCVVCLGALCYFKYFNFFVDSFAEGLSLFGIKWNPVVLDVVLPVGISFFTFQALSYTIDIMLGKIEPAGDWVEFFCFISFFPQLVAGPIERARNLLPQFRQNRTFDFNTASHGLCLIAYGLFKKMVVADTLALYVDRVFLVPELFSSVTCVIGAFFFSVQIYCDFSGYSDCARGIASMFGFKLMVNFDRPYLSSSFIEFWRRWHISLSTWFKDYVYIPLGGSRCGGIKLLRNVWIVFLLSGLWHGAAWTFIIWGVLHATYQTLNLLKRRLVGEHEDASVLERVVSVSVVNLCVIFAWIFFRARSVDGARSYLTALFTGGIKTSMMGLCAGQGMVVFLFCLISIGLLGLSYLVPHDCNFKTARGSFLFSLTCVGAIIFMGMPAGGEFIYFQF